MAITTEHREELASFVAGEVTHVALIDDEDNEIGSRQTATFVQSGVRAELDADVEFSIPAGTTVVGWRGFDASTGGTPYGGFDFSTPQEFSNEGTATLLSGDTFYSYDEV